jgi:Lar family restriction alleviation protein
MQNDLKPCPFCGSKYVFVRTTHRKDGLLNTQYEVYCYECSANGGSRTEERKAREDWNRRVDNAK